MSSPKIHDFDRTFILKLYNFRSFIDNARYRKLLRVAFLSGMLQ